MPNLSVKLDERTRQRLQALAAAELTTPHALMLKAIVAELDRGELQGAFVARALQAREKVIAGGAVLDGPGFSTYMRSRVRGENALRPPSEGLPAKLVAKA